MQLGCLGVACASISRRATVRTVPAGAFAVGRRTRRLAGREVRMHVSSPVVDGQLFQAWRGQRTWGWGADLALRAYRYTALSKWRLVDLDGSRLCSISFWLAHVDPAWGTGGRQQRQAAPKLFCPRRSLTSKRVSGRAWLPGSPS